MNKINFKHPKYIFPLFFFLFANFMFYAFSSNKDDENAVIVGNDDLQYNVGDISSVQKEKELESKFEAYQRNYNLDNKSSSSTAINRLTEEEEQLDEFDNLYNNDEQSEIAYQDARIKALQDELKKQQDVSNGGYRSSSSNNNSSTSNDDDEVMEMLKLVSNNSSSNSNTGNTSSNTSSNKENDPMELMKQQYQFIDSIERANDPELIEQAKNEARERQILEMIEKDKLSRLNVSKITHNGHFNTIKREKPSDFIKAIIDEDITGYAGSRIKIRLLEPIKVGNYVIKNGSYLYALVTGFNEQRVRLNIVSVMYENNILPIKLSIYDVDGMEGLYIPNSQFREFTKELGSSSMQGMNMNSSTGENKQQFFTSIIDRAFQSTSTTIAKLIRQNKAKLKYNTFIYLIDSDMLEENKNKIYEQNSKNK